MDSNFSKALSFVLAQEGGYNDYDWDTATNLGVTLKTWQDWVGHPVSKAQLRALTPEAVKPLYQQRYWIASSSHKMPPGLDICVFDFAVNSGVLRAIKTLQNSLKVTADGIVGPQTLAAIQNTPLKPLIAAYLAARMRFLKSLKKWAIAGKGWTNRINALKKLVAI